MHRSENGKRSRDCNYGCIPQKKKKSNSKKEECFGKKIVLVPELFKEHELSYGGCVKGRAEVIVEQSKACGRPPNMNCRVESFGRICQKFDDRRRKWVFEMGFEGLLYLCFDMHLPRKLAYWIMTCIDPVSKLFITPSGHEFRFSKNQVRWVLGIPMGPRTVPTTKTMSEDCRLKVQKILLKYGKAWESKSTKEVYTSVGIKVGAEMMDRLEGHFEDSEEEEFKTLFLVVALEMLLCPTQSDRLAADVLPAISCAMDAAEYDWCSLVLSKLMDNVCTFARRFYSKGFASGCGGCAIFAVIFYLDRLDRDPVEWAVFPRLKVWSMHNIRKAAKSDELSSGDFGNLGMLDVAYGELHPREARDTVGPCPHESADMQVFKQGVSIRNRRCKMSDNS